MALYSFLLFFTLIYSTITFTLPDQLEDFKNTSNISSIFKGYEVTDDFCDKTHEKCRKTDGKCSISDDGESINCICKGSVQYSMDTGCKITDDFCDKTQEKCRQTSGKCSISDDGESINCICEGGIKYSMDTGCKNKCSTIECHNDGRCYIKNGTATCNCTENFTGKYCEKNKCSMIKCHNDGRCYINNGTATCSCTENFTGKYCEKNVTSLDDAGDDILLSFYVNKNSTFAKGAKFDFHFGRKNVSNRILTQVLLRFNSESVVPSSNDKCSLIICKNGGSCEVKNGKATCVCTDEHFGDFCEKKCNCKNGKCVEVSGKVDCICNPEFGKYEEGICKACGCGKGATCSFKGGIGSHFKNKTCICPENFIEIHHVCVDPEVYNPCRFNPCENGARCEKNGVEAKCICPPGYSGKLCQYDECSLIKCQNGGKCAIKNEKVVCMCDDQFFGEFCEKDKCSLKKCLNGGRCEIRNQRTICICSDNFSGEFCEKKNRGYVHEGLFQTE